MKPDETWLNLIKPDKHLIKPDKTWLNLINTWLNLIKADGFPPKNNISSNLFFVIFCSTCLRLYLVEELNGLNQTSSLDDFQLLKFTCELSVLKTPSYAAPFFTLTSQVEPWKQQGGQFSVCSWCSGPN